MVSGIALNWTATGSIAIQKIGDLPEWWNNFVNIFYFWRNNLSNITNLIKGKIIIFNGSPGTGKDTIANYLFNCSRLVNRESFKEPLFRIAAAVSGMDIDLLYELYEQPGWKEIPQKQFDGLSCRELFITISEEWVKPLYGKSYFGDEMAGRLLDIVQYGVVVSDGGFPEEILPLIEAYGNENIVIVRIHREGHTYQNDSRRMLHPWDFPEGKKPVFIDVENAHATAEEFCKAVVDVLEQELKVVSYDKH
jgi:hypothetical protein